MRPESWACFVGFLAGRQATIYAQIKDWAFDDWADRYRLATGMSVPADGHFQIVPPDMNKWACSASIAFTATRGEFMSACGYSALPLDVEVKDGTGGRLMIYAESVMWDLFDGGFVLGTRQPIAAIREHMAEALHPHFDSGLRLAGS